MPLKRGVVMPRETNAAKRERAVEVCERLNFVAMARSSAFWTTRIPLGCSLRYCLGADDRRAGQQGDAGSCLPSGQRPRPWRGRAWPMWPIPLSHSAFYKEQGQARRGGRADDRYHYGGEVPADMKELVKLPGVGRKTANIVLNVGFGIVGYRGRYPRQPHRAPPDAESQDTRQRAAQRPSRICSRSCRTVLGSVSHQWITFGREGLRRPQT